METCISKMREITSEFSKKVENPIIIGGYGVASMKAYLDKLLEGFKVHSIARIGPGISAHVGPEVFALAIGRGLI